MYFITPTNDTAFVGGPVSVTASTDTPSDAPPVPIAVPTIYVGVGANAVGVSILTTGASVLSGDTVTLNAVALDASGAPIPGTPMQIQLWYRDPQNTSNRTTSLSDAIEIDVCP